MAESRIFKILDQLSCTQQVILVCALSLLLRIFFSFFSHGFMYIDEVHFYLDPAAWNQYKIGVLSESTKSFYAQLPGRSPISIFIFSAMLSFCEFLNISDPLSQVIMIRIFLSLWSLVGIVSIYYLTLSLYPGKKNIAFWAALLSAVWGYHIYSNLRTLGECVSIPAILCSFWFFHRSLSKPSRIRLIFSGMLMGLAISLKVQSGLFLMGIGIYCLFHRNIFHLIYFSIGFLVLFCFQGTVDLFTHGAFLKSFFDYIHLRMSSSEFNVPKAYGKFFWFLFVIHFPLLFPFIIYFILKDIRRNQLLVFSVFVYLGVHFYHPSTDLRLYLVVVPIFLTLFMASFLNWHPRKKYFKKIIYGLIFVAVVSQFMAVFFPEPFRPKWRRDANLCFAQAYVGRQLDSTGLLMMHVRWAQLYFYVRKKIPVTKVNHQVLSQNIQNYDTYNYFILRKKDKKGRETNLPLDPKLIQDFNLNDAPIQIFGDHSIYKRK